MPARQFRTAKIVDQGPKILFQDEDGAEYEIDVSFTRAQLRAMQQNRDSNTLVNCRRTAPAPLPDLPVGTVARGNTNAGNYFTKLPAGWYPTGTQHLDAYPAYETDNGLFRGWPGAVIINPFTPSELTRPEALRIAGLLP